MSIIFALNNLSSSFHWSCFRRYSKVKLPVFIYYCLILFLGDFISKEEKLKCFFYLLFWKTKYSFCTAIYSLCTWLWCFWSWSERNKYKKKCQNVRLDFCVCVYVFEAKKELYSLSLFQKKSWVRVFRWQWNDNCYLMSEF